MRGGSWGFIGGRHPSGSRVQDDPLGIDHIQGLELLRIFSFSWLVLLFNDASEDAILLFFFSPDDTSIDLFFFRPAGTNTGDRQSKKVAFREKSFFTLCLSLFNEGMGATNNWVIGIAAGFFMLTITKKTHDQKNLHAMQAVGGEMRTLKRPSSRFGFPRCWLTGLTVAYLRLLLCYCLCLCASID